MEALLAAGRGLWQVPSVRVLVTGSAGFVGQHLVPRLEAAGWQVTGRDRDLDVGDAAAVRAELARTAPSAVIHLAAQSSVAASFEAAGQTFRVNYLGARHLLAAVRQEAPEARVLLIGSGDVYGAAAPGGPAFDEAQPLRPRSPYARSKACADLLGAAYAARGLDVVRVRPFNHTGAGQSDAFVLPSFARQAVEIASGAREPLLRVGNLDSVRDFLDVEDVVSAYLALLDPRVPAATYNVASGVPRRVGDLLDALLARTGAPAKLVHDPARWRPTDHAVGDARALRAATGWAPRVPLERTLDRLIEWQRARTA